MRGFAKVSIKHLRKDFPSWTWRVVREGMAVRYAGTKRDRSVYIHSVSVLCGPAEDDCTTQWRVSEGERSETFACFFIKETAL